MRFLRARIVQELMQTERDYVNLLQNIVQVKKFLTFAMIKIRNLIEICCFIVKTKNRSLSGNTRIQ